jgi:DNA mismatch repair protein MutL
VLMSDRRELFILDQHAAHERVAFELLQSEPNTQPASVPLLVPRIIELTKDQIATLESCRDEFALMGVVVEPFGDDAYRICALPGGYGERHFDLVGILDDLAADPIPSTKVAADLQSGSVNVASDLQVGLARKRREKLLATIACHSVVRAHEPLSLQEQLTLYERLRACREPHTCPHGRPTMLRFDAATLAKAFRRT